MTKTYSYNGSSDSRLIMTADSPAVGQKTDRIGTGFCLELSRSVLGVSLQLDEPEADDGSGSAKSTAGVSSGLEPGMGFSSGMSRPMSGVSLRMGRLGTGIIS